MRGYGAKWRAYRTKYIEQNPYCVSAECAAIPLWRRPLATDVDHIDGLGPLGPRGYDPANMQSLCHRCHSIKTAREDGAFGRGKG